MNKFESQLDKYLTADPRDLFQEYAQQVCDKLSDEAISYDEKTDFTCSAEFNSVLEALYIAGVMVDAAAYIAEKVFENYIYKPSKY